MKYSINVKYWHGSHDHELFFATKDHAYRIFRALKSVAVDNVSDIEFLTLWDEENNNILECIHF
jgi:hypothetical protein